MTTPDGPGPAAGRTGSFTGREWGLLLVLAAVQFCVVVDFVLIMPMAPLLLRALDVAPRAFGVLVSAYTLGAAAAGLLAANLMDRFDRKRALLVLLAGFGVGTLLCGLAAGYATLLAARLLAGVFGGVLAAVLFAIVGDEIRAERRGSAMGLVMGAFSAASVLGLPLGLSLATRAGWRAPFVWLAALIGLVWVAALLLLAPMRTHLAGGRPRSSYRELLAIAREPAAARAWLLTFAITTSGYVLLPFMSTYLVLNAGLPERRLDLVYLAGGLATIVTGPLLFGPLADRFGAARVFGWAALASAAPIVVVTNLPPSPMWLILAVTTLMMVTMSGRMICATSLVTGVVAPSRRGRFMSLNSAVQHGAGAVASAAAGLVIGGASGGAITNFGVLGAASVGATVAAIVIARGLRGR